MLGRTPERRRESENPITDFRRLTEHALGCQPSLKGGGANQAGDLGFPVRQYGGDFVVAGISDREFGRRLAIRALRELADELDGEGCGTIVEWNSVLKILTIKNRKERQTVQRKCSNTAAPPCATPCPIWEE